MPAKRHNQEFSSVQQEAGLKQTVAAAGTDGARAGIAGRRGTNPTTAIQQAKAQVDAQPREEMDWTPVWAVKRETNGSKQNIMCCKQST